MKDFFQSTKFKILAAVFVVLCAFMLRATMSGGLTPLTSQLLSVVTTPLQSAASGISESVGGLYRHLFQAGEIEEENAQLTEALEQAQQTAQQTALAYELLAQAQLARQAQDEAALAAALQALEQADGEAVLSEQGRALLDSLRGAEHTGNGQ